MLFIALAYFLLIDFYLHLKDPFVDKIMSCSPPFSK